MTREEAEANLNASVASLSPAEAADFAHWIHDAMVSDNDVVRSLAASVLEGHAEVVGRRSGEWKFRITEKGSLAALKLLEESPVAREMINTLNAQAGKAPFVPSRTKRKQ